MLHVAYINSCRPDDGRWTTETCRNIEFYNDIPVIRAYIIVFDVTYCTKFIVKNYFIGNSAKDIGGFFRNNIFCSSNLNLLIRPDGS
jgi:hypothetical protein